MKIRKRVAVNLGVWLLLAAGMLFPARAQETAAANPEIERLKAQLAAQQEQIDQLRRTLEDQKKELDQFSQPHPPSLGQVASTTPVIPVGNPAPPLHPGLAGALGQPPGEEPASPLQVRIGTATFTPVGFLDFTAVFRSADSGNSIGTNFGSTPYVNAASGLGKLSEFRLSAQNSRIGMRIDALVHGTKVMGYWESDFLGTQATNAGVSTHSDSFRMRLYWIDFQRNNWEILGGQSWSMLTPNRKGISPLPGDIFYSQDMDTNYQVGIPWTRAPQFRAVYHPSQTVTFGLALETSDQYGGGSAGGGTFTLPCSTNNPNLTPPAPNKSCTPLNTALTSQIDFGTSTYSVPNLTPDFQAKLALDPLLNGKLMHVEFAGFLTSFKTYNPTLSESFSKEGGGGEANFNLELVKGLHLIVNGFVSDGGGRYLFGQAPDLVINANGDPLPLHSAATSDGFEYYRHNTILFAYYGGDYFGRTTVIDTSNNINAGAPGMPAPKYPVVGYGYKGSANSQNRTIQEATIGFNQTLWKNPNYGALNTIFQYSYLWRNPWVVAAGAPRYAHNNMIWLDLRYTLPGQAPVYK
jgi:hypothetical protein